jgi:hypothetical protein
MVGVASLRFFLTFCPPILLLVLAPLAGAADCTSEGSEPCTCSCDRLTDVIVESKGRGTCRSLEEYAARCDLNWNSGGPAHRQAADAFADSAATGALDFQVTFDEFTFDATDCPYHGREDMSERWMRFADARGSAPDRSAEFVATSYMSNTPPYAYELHMMLPR